MNKIGSAAIGAIGFDGEDGSWSAIHAVSQIVQTMREDRALAFRPVRVEQQSRVLGKPADLDLSQLILFGNDYSSNGPR